MKLAALYDIHANPPALEAILHEIESVGPELIIISGDVVSGPQTNETLALLRSIAIQGALRVQYRQYLPQN